AEITLRDGRDDLGDVAHLEGQVVGHGVDVLGELTPHAGDAAHLGLSPEDAVRADLTGDAGHLVGEGAQLPHHGVDGVLQLLDLALHLDVDGLGEVPLGDGRRHAGDLAHLRGEVARHQVDAVGDLPPHPRVALDARLRAE